jgi:hypothetical protein
LASKFLDLVSGMLHRVRVLLYRLQKKLKPEGDGGFIPRVEQVKSAADLAAEDLGISAARSVVPMAQRNKEVASAPV